MLSGNGLKAAQPCPARATEDRPRGTRRRAGKPRGIQCRTAAPGYFSPGLRYERPNLHDGSDDIGFRASWLAGDGPVRASSDIAPAASHHLPDDRPPPWPYRARPSKGDSPLTFGSHLDYRITPTHGRGSAPHDNP